ncbi:MAG: TolC family protein, partial [Pseudomonadales bacterium]
MKIYKLHITLLCAALGLAGCTGIAPQSAIDPSTAQPPSQTQWSNRTTPVHSAPSTSPWESTFTSPALGAAISRALSTNRDLIAQRASVERARQQLIITGAARQLNASSTLQSSRTKSTAGVNTAIDLSLNLQLTLDVWGKLSHEQQAAQLDLASAQAQLRRTQFSLQAQITDTWYRVVADNALLSLLTSRQKNLQAQLSGVQSSYRRGLASALDIYLARNDVQSAHTQVVTQRQTLHDNSRALQRLLGDYPSGNIEVDDTLAHIEDDFSPGVPASLMQRRADLTALWLDVLAQDKRIAASYLDRFPQFTLQGNTSVSSAQLSNLLQQNVAWSLLSTVTQTLFDGGRKEAANAQAKATLIEREQAYLKALDSALSDVEGALKRERTVQQRSALNLQALENAQLAEQQVQNQYANGLADFTQVLSVQRTLYDAQQQVISLQQQRVANRIALISALGGEPEAASTPT